MVALPRGRHGELCNANSADSGDNIVTQQQAETPSRGLEKAAVEKKSREQIVTVRVTGHIA